MTNKDSTDLVNIFNNLTDTQLAVLKGKIEEEQKTRDQNKIEQYYNKLADLIDEIRDNGFEIYYDTSPFEISELYFATTERA